MQLFICVLALAAIVMSDSSLDLLQTGNEQFTSNMFQEVVKANKPGENIVLSAFSVLSPLAQLGLASVGQSHDEILRAIGLPNDNVTKDVFSNVNKRLRSVKGVELSQANRVYVRKGSELNEQYAVVSREVFNSDVRNIDFSKPTAAAQEINAWVEDHTNHRIKDLVQASSLNAATAAVLVNAIYFKGTWKKQFNKALTADRPFYVSITNVVNKPTMYKSDDFKYGESNELDAKLLELPYDGDQASLLVVLPNEIGGINSLVEKLRNPSLLANARENMYNTLVEVTLPKFRIETETDLGAILQKMNVVKLFTPGEAHLDNLLKDTSDLFISSAVQKAFIDVNEEGVEAAAANEFGIAYLSAIVSEKLTFTADHPFVFFLMEENNILFNGVFQS